jgi:hypothetical protein
MTARPSRDHFHHAWIYRPAWIAAIFAAMPASSINAQAYLQQQQAYQAYQQQQQAYGYMQMQQEQQRREQQAEQYRQQQQMWRSQQQAADMAFRQQEELHRQQKQHWQRQEEERQRLQQQQTWTDWLVGGAQESFDGSSPVETDPSESPADAAVDDEPRTEAYPQDFPRGHVALNWLLLGIVAGIIATLVAKSRHSTVLPAKHALRSLLPEARSAASRAAQFARAIRPRLNDLRINFLHLLHDIAQRVLAQLRRMVPSRRTVLRFAHLAAGLTLLAYALVGFTAGDVFVPFVMLTVGYFTAASFWFARWDTHDSENDITHKPAAPARKPRLLPRPKRTCLRCDPCRKLFRVHGEGELGPRVIPCPECGSALQPHDHAQRTASFTMPSGAAIASVVCRHCRAIIDLPPAAPDTCFACPRCSGELPIHNIL